MTEQLAVASAPTFGLELGLLPILAFLWLWISGGFRELVAPAAPSRPSSIRLGTPLLVAMSADEAADAAHLLGSSLAALLATHAEAE
jgi:hypothetical protein